MLRREEENGTENCIEAM